MNAIEWAVHLELHGMDGIHAAARRIDPRPIVFVVPTDRDSRLEARRERDRVRKAASYELTKAERHANMLAMVKGAA